jgi:SAM-dependent methyltransferase
VEHTVLETLSSCPICGAQEFRDAITAVDHTVSNESFTLVDCSSCGGRFTSPRPDQASIGAYYRSESYISHSNTADSLQDRLYQATRKWALGRKHRVLSVHRSSGRVLDIGCGTGEFLGYLKSRGYLVQGVEPDLGAREQAIANHALEVVPTLDAVPSSEQFNVVTMWHVLEHVPDPRKTLKKIYSVMADRGFLVIAVPDRESWDAEHYGPEWAAYDVPRHLYHFRRSDVHRLLLEHGFVTLTTGPMWMDAPYIALLSERYRGRETFLALVLGSLVGAWSNVLALVGRRPTSSSLFIAQKQEP